MDVELCEDDISMSSTHKDLGYVVENRIYLGIFGFLL